VAISAGWFHSLALLNDGSIVGWGDNSHGQAASPGGNPNYVAISAGGYHNLALHQGGAWVAWGDNTYHQTTHLSNTLYTTALSAGAYHSAILANGGKPAIQRQPVDRIASPNSSVTFDVGVEGQSPLIYQWRFNGRAVPGATDSSY